MSDKPQRTRDDRWDQADPLLAQLVSDHDINSHRGSVERDDGLWLCVLAAVCACIFLAGWMWPEHFGRIGLVIVYAVAGLFSAGVLWICFMAFAQTK